MSASSQTETAPLGQQPLLDVYDVENSSIIGVGAIAKVVRASKRSSQISNHSQEAGEDDVVAVKILSKLQLLQMQKVEAVKLEKRILQMFGRRARGSGEAGSSDARRHVVRLLGTSQSDHELFFFMEELTGGDLQEHLSQTCKIRAGLPQSSPAPSRWLPGLFCLSFNDTRLILAQLFDALETIHTHPSGYTLRDVKSENICFTSTGVLTLIDFDAADEQRGLLPEANFGDPLGRRREQDQLRALARNPTGPTTLNAQQARHDAETRRKTVSEIQGARKMSLINFVGTTQFVSPELLGQLKWSYASDLWAVGVVLYQCVFGRYPFDGANPFDIMKEIVKGVEPWRHFPLYRKHAAVCGADSADASSTQQTTVLTPNPDLFTEAQYAGTCDLIEELLQLDPVRRIGVAGSNFRRRNEIPPDTCEVGKPDYAQIRSHPFFEGFDWERLHHAVDAALQNKEDSTFTNAAECAHTLQSMYDLPPCHSDSYSVTVEDSCAVGSPITDWVVGASSSENTADSPASSTPNSQQATTKSLDQLRDERKAQLQNELAGIASTIRQLKEFIEENYPVTRGNDEGNCNIFANEVTRRHVNAHIQHLEFVAAEAEEAGNHEIKCIEERIEKERLMRLKSVQDSRGLLQDNAPPQSDVPTEEGTRAVGGRGLGISNPYAPTTVVLDAVDLRQLLEEDACAAEDDVDNRVVDDVGVRESFDPTHTDFH